MKTLTYNPEKEILTALAILFFSIAMMSKANGQGPLSDLTLYTDTFGSDSEESLATNPTAADLVEYEPAIEIQGWMLNNSYWGAAVNDNYRGVTDISENTEADKPLTIERWMTSNNHFGFYEQEPEADTYQKIEPWMNSAAYWTGVRDQFPENLAEK